MAYVLMVLGVLMAAAGLYVIGYGWFDARFEDYWNALAAGATLTAGGTVTVALAFAVRALLDMRAALVAKPIVPATEATAERPAPPINPPAAVAAASNSGTSEADLETPPRIEPDVPVPTVPQEPHPLRRKPYPSETQEFVPFASSTAADVAHAESGASEVQAVPEPSTPLVTAHAETDMRDFGLSHDDGQSTYHDQIATARPADDYKIEMPSTPDHDLPTRDSPRHDSPRHDSSKHDSSKHDSPDGLPRVDSAGARDLSFGKPQPVIQAKIDDWFDRALADIDEQLPLHAPAQRGPEPASPLEKPSAEPDPPPKPAATLADPTPPTAEPWSSARPEEPQREPAMAEAEPVHAGAEHGERTAANAVSAVIGRYEADGTSYVMYADGSIEAQSSAGVYRFSSMAELKSFIEH